MARVKNTGLGWLDSVLEVERVAKGNCVVVHEGRVDGDPLNPGQIMAKVKEVL